MGVRGAVATAVALACDVGCTALNPAFEGGALDESTAGETSAKATEPASSGDTTAGSAPTSSGTGPDPDTSAATTVPPTSTGPETGEGTTGAVCEIDVPDRIGVTVQSSGNVEPPPCGQFHTIIGTAGPVQQPGGLELAVCDGGACDCGAKSTPVAISFTHLSPSPEVALPEGMSRCVALTIRWADVGAGCHPMWIAMEPVEGVVDYPSYMAAAGGFVPVGITLPDVALDDPLSECERIDCGGGDELAPGQYKLAIGDAPPAAEGEVVPVMLNPYAGVEAEYLFTTQYARIVPDCQRHLAWAAFVEPG